MAGYDPKRTRPVTTEVAPDEPSAVDALLDAPVTGSTPVVVPDRAPEPVSEPEPVVEPLVAEPAAASPVADEPPIPVDVPVAPAPDRRTARLAIVGGVAAATVAAVMLVRRLRRR